MKGNNCMLEIIYVQKCLHWDSVGPLQHLTQSFWRILLLIKMNKKSSKALVASTEVTLSRSWSEQCGSCSNLRLFGKMLLSGKLYWRKCKHLPGAQQGDRWLCLDLGIGSSCGFGAMGDVVIAWISLTSGELLPSFCHFTSGTAGTNPKGFPCPPDCKGRSTLHGHVSAWRTCLKWAHPEIHCNLLRRLKWLQCIPLGPLWEEDLVRESSGRERQRRTCDAVGKPTSAACRGVLWHRGWAVAFL